MPNPTSSALVRAADAHDRWTLFRNDLVRAARPGAPANPHTFLTNIANVAVADLAIGAHRAGSELMKRVFFVGAGASVDDGFPVTSDLMPALAHTMRRRGSGDRGTHRLYDYLNTVYGVSKDHIDCAATAWQAFVTDRRPIGPQPLPSIIELPSRCRLPRHGSTVPRAATAAPSPVLPTNDGTKGRDRVVGAAPMYPFRDFSGRLHSGYMLGDGMDPRWGGRR